METGQKIPNFTAATTDGTTFALDQALANHNAVVITTFPLCFTGS